MLSFCLALSPAVHGCAGPFHSAKVILIPGLTESIRIICNYEHHYTNLCNEIELKGGPTKMVTFSTLVGIL